MKPLLACVLPLSLVVAMAPSCPAAAARPEAESDAIPVPRDVERQIREVVPKGWSVSVKGSRLVVRRDRPVPVYFSLPNAAPQDPAQPRKPPTNVTFEITLRFLRPISPARYRRLRAENEATAKKLEALRENLRRRVSHKFDDFLPRTDEEKRLVAEYRRAQKTLPHHRLPDSYTKGCSVRTSTSQSPFAVHASAATKKECDRVRETILGLFHGYRHEEGSAPK